MALHDERETIEYRSLGTCCSPKKLTFSLQDWEKVFEASLQSTMILSPDHVILKANGKAVEVSGLSMDELIGRKCSEIFHRHVGSPEDCPFANVFESGGAASVEVEAEALGKWFLVSCTPVFDDDEKLRFVVHVAADITEKKLAEMALNESEARFRNIVEATPLGIHRYRLDDEGRLIFIGANKSADRILGVDNDQFVGKTIEEAFTPLIDTEIPERYREVAQKGIVWSTEHVEYTDDRIAGAYELYAFPTEPGSMAVLFLDTTERRRQQAERAEIEQQLLQAQKMESVGRLAGGLAHDFNNLLTGIMGTAELSLMQLSVRDPLFKNMEDIIADAERAAGLTSQLLAFSRKQLLEPRVVNLNKLLTNMSKMLGRLIGEDIQLDLNLAEDLRKVKVDPGQIEQVILNLVVNAKDAMPNGGRLLLETDNVEVDDLYTREHPWASPGSYAMLAVSDTGTGMSEEVAKHAFEPFFTTKEVGKGTGLGLSTAYGIIKQSEGWIHVYSELGEGTVFKIYLPIMVGEAEILDSREPIEAMTRGTEEVLLVEDDEVVRTIAIRVLARAGYKVTTARNGGEAILICERRERAPELLITDVVMPHMSGVELAKRLRGRWPALNVLFMSGYSQDFMVHQGVVEANVPYIQKPFRAVAFATKVRKAIDAHRR